MTRWLGLSSTKRQAQELIVGPSPTVETMLPSFNRTQSMVITYLLTGCNTLRRQLHLMELTNSPLCRRTGAEDVTSAHILCKCEAVAALRHDIKSVKSGDHMELSKGTGLPWTRITLWGTKDLFLRPRSIWTIRAQTQLLINQSVTPWRNERRLF